MSTITLKDMANDLKLSVSTVSKALNNRIDVSQETSKRIKDLAKNYNYTPNNVAIALRKKKNHMLAIIIPEIKNEACISFLSEIQKKSYANGYKLLLLQSFESSIKEQQCVDFIKDGTVDGIIILSFVNNNNRKNIPIPYVTIELNKLDIKNVNHKELATLYFTRLLQVVN